MYASFKYTICHPDKEEIERPERVLSQSEALDMATNYPWEELLNQIDEMDQDEIYYSPSLEFINQKNKHSFTLTANKGKNGLEFSLWYLRVVETGRLMKFFGKHTKEDLSDKWGFTLAESLSYLSFFLNEKENEVEKIYAK